MNKQDSMLEPYLALYLPLFELDGSSFISRDACGHLCTAIGTTWRPAGRYFNGVDDSINCGNATSLQIVSDITIIVWLKRGLADFTENKYIISKLLTTGNQRSYGLYIGANEKISFSISPDGLPSGAGNTISTDADYTSTIELYYVAVTWKASTKECSIYVNGALVKTGTTLSNTIYNSTANIRIGSIDNPSNHFPGIIRDCIVYNRALSPLEIQNLYLATK